MNVLNTIRYSQDIKNYRKMYANKLYDKYCELHNSLINHMREYNRYEKTKNAALKKSTNNSLSISITILQKNLPNTL